MHVGPKMLFFPWNKLTYNDAALEHLSETHFDCIGSHTRGAVRSSIGSSHGVYYNVLEYEQLVKKQDFLWFWMQFLS
jgi:hypothetical protein